MRPPMPALAGGGLALVTLVLLGQLPFKARWASALTDFAHVPTFAMLTLVILALLRQTLSRHGGSFARDCALAIALALAVGVLIEVVQGAIGRDASTADVLRDALGALLATGWLVFFRAGSHATRWSRPVRVAGLLTGVLCSAAALAPLGVAAAAYLERNRNFPVLADFASPLGAYFLNYDKDGLEVEPERLPRKLAGDAAPVHCIHVRIANGSKWWGLFLTEPLPDWRGYDRLLLDIANPTDAPLVLSLRIRDRRQLRASKSGYSTRLTVAPRSRQATTVPLDRFTTATGTGLVDARNVGLVLLSRNKRNRADEFYVMRAWLE